MRRRRTRSRWFAWEKFQARPRRGAFSSPSAARPRRRDAVAAERTRGGGGERAAETAAEDGWRGSSERGADRRSRRGEKSRPRVGSRRPQNGAPRLLKTPLVSRELAGGEKRRRGRLFQGRARIAERGGRSRRQTRGRSTRSMASSTRGTRWRRRDARRPAAAVVGEELEEQRRVSVAAAEDAHRRLREGRVSRGATDWNGQVIAGELEGVDAAAARAAAEGTKHFTNGRGDQTVGGSRLCARISDRDRSRRWWRASTPRRCSWPPWWRRTRRASLDDVKRQATRAARRSRAHRARREGGGAPDAARGGERRRRRGDETRAHGGETAANAEETQTEKREALEEVENL